VSDLLPLFFVDSRTKRFFSSLLGSILFFIASLPLYADHKMMTAAKEEEKN